MIPERIEREVLIDAPLEVVWSVVTEPEHVSRWFSDHAAIDLRPGGEARLTWDDAGTAHARVETVERPHFFSFRWMPWRREQPVDDRHATLVEFSLAADGDGTRLRVVESGWRQLDGPAEETFRNSEENRGGWERELGELVEYVSTL